MKQYKINEVELTFLKDMINYLNEDGNFMSDDGSKLFKEVVDRVLSRPALDVIIDTDAIDAQVEEQMKEFNQETNTND